MHQLAVACNDLPLHMKRDDDSPKGTKMSAYAQNSMAQQVPRQVINLSLEAGTFSPGSVLSASTTDNGQQSVMRQHELDMSGCNQHGRVPAPALL